MRCFSVPLNFSWFSIKWYGTSTKFSSGICCFAPKRKHPISEQWFSGHDKFVHVSLEIYSSISVKAAVTQHQPFGVTWPCYALFIVVRSIENPSSIYVLQWNFWKVFMISVCNWNLRWSRNVSDDGILSILSDFYERKAVWWSWWYGMIIEFR